MNKVYVIAPLAGLLAFSGVYWKYAQAYVARRTAQEHADELKRQQKHAAQVAAQARASEEAKQQNAKRQLERAEKERAEEMQRQLRTGLEEARQSAADRTRQLRPQIDRLRSEVNSTTAALARAEERSRQLRSEQQFLVEYVRRAESNRSALFQLLEKIEFADRQDATIRRDATQDAGKS